MTDSPQWNPAGQQSMDTAPKDRPILIWNPCAGWLATQYVADAPEKKHWPMFNGPYAGHVGYGHPYGWRELPGWDSDESLHMAFGGKLVEITP